MWWARLLNVISGLLSGGAAPAAATSYESIATYTVGAGGQASITFSSIPQTYKHLQLRLTSTGSTNTVVQGRFNSDATYTNYRTHWLLGDGSSASASDRQESAWAGIFTGFVSTSSVAPASVTDILDYTNTNKNTTTRSLIGWDNNGSGYIYLASSLWLNTAAVTSLKIFPYNETSNFAQYTHAALYGIKG